jgi:hypothetical protein
VTAPGGKELDEGDAGLDLSLEVFLVKLGNRRSWLRNTRTTLR